MCLVWIKIIVSQMYQLIYLHEQTKKSKYDFIVQIRRTYNKLLNLKTIRFLIDTRSIWLVFI